MGLKPGLRLLNSRGGEKILIGRISGANICASFFLKFSKLGYCNVSSLKIIKERR